MKNLFLILLAITSLQVSAMDLDFNITEVKTINTESITTHLPATLHSRVEAIIPVISSVSKSLNADSNLIASIAWTESTFKKASKSKVGAKGLMQLMPKTRKEVMKKMGSEFNVIFSQNLNSGLSALELEDIIVGTYYINSLLKKFNNNQDHAIIAYNMGSGWLNKKLNAKKVVGQDNNYLNKVKTNMSLVASL